MPGDKKKLAVIFLPVQFCIYFMVLLVIRPFVQIIFDVLYILRQVERFSGHERKRPRTGKAGRKHASSEEGQELKLQWT